MKRGLRLLLVESALLWSAVFAMLWPHAVQAASFATDVRGYDFESLMWAVVMSLMGGALRTIFTLASDATVVVSFSRELLKDAVVAMVAGILAYIVVQAFDAFSLFKVASEVRLAVIVFAGWSRLSFFGWLNTLGTKVTDAVNQRVVSAIAAKSMDDPLPTADPASPAMPAPGTSSKPKPFNEVQP
jgi:hypothetical protein